MIVKVVYFGLDPFSFFVKPGLQDMNMWLNAILDFVRS